MSCFNCSNLFFYYICKNHSIMYLSNYHSHCTFCDGRSTMEEFVRFAIAKGIYKYGFSSHAPLPFHTKWNMPEDDFDDYVKEFLRLKTKYDDRIELYLGLEIDYIEGCTDVGKNLFRSQKLDFTICSIHYLDKISENEYWSIDGAFCDFDKGLKMLYGGDIQAGVKRFFELSTRMIEKGGFDIVGHLDKIIYHGIKMPEFNIYSKWYFNLMSDILELIKKNNLILEINTKSLLEFGFTYPHQMFYPLIREFDIPIVVNSDCHYPTNITDGFQQTFNALKKAGFKTTYQLFNGQWLPVEIDG